MLKLLLSGMCSYVDDTNRLARKKGAIGLRSVLVHAPAEVQMGINIDSKKSSSQIKFTTLPMKE